MPETFTGVVTELGGAELAASGNEKPRKVVIKDDPSKQYGKTFRTWSNSEAWNQLQNLNGQKVTVEFVVEERQGGPQGTYTQNFLTGVLENGSGGASVSGEAAHAVGQTPTPTNGNGSWGTPPSNWAEPPAAITPQASPTVSKDDYWDRREATDHDRSLQMEAAWAVKAVLDVSAGEKALSDDEVIEHALKLAILKRRVASELGK